MPFIYLVDAMCQAISHTQDDVERKGRKLEIISTFAGFAKRGLSYTYPLFCKQPLEVLDTIENRYSYFVGLSMISSPHEIRSKGNLEKVTLSSG